MGRFLAVMEKELKVLRRDRSGLAVLFLMPVVLVLVVSLVQENVLKTMGESGVKVFFVNGDTGSLGAAVASRLAQNGGVAVLPGENRAKVLAAIADGDAQFGIVIEEGATDALRKRARRMAVSGKGSASAIVGEAAGRTDLSPFLKVYFDPAVRGLLRTAVMSSLKLAVYEMEMTEKLKIFSGVMAERLAAGGSRYGDFQVKSEGAGRPDPLPGYAGGPDGGSGRNAVPERPGSAAGFTGQDPMAWLTDPLVKIEDAPAFSGKETALPTSVQQNVPAWALFGIFFVVVPMGASLIKEREDGTHLRVSAMPVSPFTVVAGKLAAYSLICLIQFGLILMIGKYLLPALGTPVLSLGDSLLPLALVLFSSILAATGYGILLGTVLSTYEQVSMFGPTSIVIAAALGGIMVPVYAMPAAMQKLSVISPLGWGLGGIHDVIIRGGDLRMVLPEVASLLIFAFFSISVGSFCMFFKGK